MNYSVILTRLQHQLAKQVTLSVAASFFSELQAGNVRAVLVSLDTVLAGAALSKAA